MPVFDEESHGHLCFGSFCPHYTVLNKLPAARARALYSMAALAPLVFHFARFTFRRLSTPVDCSRRRRQPELWEFYLPCAPVAQKK